MSNPSPSIPPPAPSATADAVDVDLGAVQRDIVDQLRQAEAQLERAQQRVWALRGQLDLITRLGRPAGQS